MTQVVLIMNTDVGHDTMNPKLLVPFSDPIVDKQTDVINDENMIGILTIDFITVKSIKLVYVTDSFVGLSSLNSESICITTVLFKQPVFSSNINTTAISVCQILVGGVMTGDLDYIVSKHFGHQGASAKRPSVFDLVEKFQLEQMWDKDSPQPEPKTMEMIKKDSATYKARYVDLPANQKNISTQKDCNSE